MKTSDIVIGEAYAYRASSYSQPVRVVVTATNQTIYKRHRRSVSGANGVAIQAESGKQQVVRPQTIERTWAEHEQDEADRVATAEEAEIRRDQQYAARATFAKALHDKMTEEGLASTGYSYAYEDRVNAALVAAGMPVGATRSHFDSPVPNVDGIVRKGEVKMSIATLAALLGIDVNEEGDL